MSRTRVWWWPGKPAQLVVGSHALAAVPAAAQIGNFNLPAASITAPAVGAPLGRGTTSAAGVQPSTWAASVLVLETLTDNVNLSPSGSADGALVTEIRPLVAVNHRGSHTNLVGKLALPIVLYVPSGVAGDRVYPSVNLVGDVALVQNLLFVEGAVSVTQQFFSPFGAQPVSVTNPSQNRYRSDLFRLSPYIKGTTQANTYYELRNDNVWTNLSGAPISTSGSYYTSFSGLAGNVQGTLGWQGSFNYTDVQFNNQSPITTQIYRLAGIYNVNQQLRLSVSGGYEYNRGTLTSSRDVIYGAGFVWHPTPRTNVAGDYEQRFFGSSYRFAFDHNTPLSAWKVRLNRTITTYPQQIATVPGGVDVAAFLNSLFVYRIPDPAERQTLIDEFIQNRGLPSSLSSPLDLYTEQILLQQSATASATLIGARNTVLMRVFYLKSEPITAAGTPLPPLLVGGNDNTQTGGTLVWTHQVTPSMVLSASADGVRTVGNSGGNTKQGTVRIAMSRPITPLTSAFVGARYQVLQSNIASDYTETAAFVGLNHSFR